MSLCQAPSSPLFDNMARAWYFLLMPDLVRNPPDYSNVVDGERVAFSLTAINRSELSRCTGANLSYVSRIFNPADMRRPSGDMALRLCRCLGWTVEELYGFLDGLGKPPYPSAK